MAQTMGEIKRENIAQQIKMIEGFITLWQVKILSGAYKLEKITNFEGIEYSDEYKLERAIGALENQTHRLAECVDTFMSS